MEIQKFDRRVYACRHCGRAIVGAYQEYDTDYVMGSGGEIVAKDCIVTIYKAIDGTPCKDGCGHSPLTDTEVETKSFDIRQTSIDEGKGIVH